MPFSRRDLLSRGALLVAAGLTVPSFISRTAQSLGPATADSPKSNKILVALQLSGGNDGLNTLVPFGHQAYYDLRPTLAVDQKDVLAITDTVGLHPGLAGLKELYDGGHLAIVQGVGYPNPNRSHFRSMDIWHSARPESFEVSGWLGRYLDACSCTQGEAMPGISVGDQLNGVFWTDTTLVPAVASVGAFSYQTDSKYKNDRASQLKTLKNIYQQAGHWAPNDTLIRKGTIAALAGSDELARVANAYQSPVEYPANNGLGNQLKMVAQVIAGNLGTRLFSVQIGGFDTHSAEKDTHSRLMGQLSDALGAFWQDLGNLGRQDDVVVMTFSEFGRRAAQNGSAGTDHGTAEPMFVLGGSVTGGLYGTYPSLDDLDNNGDIKFNADFRSVYAGVLQQHLGADAAKVLGGSFDPIALIGAPAAA
jgi:uncharacterized protein (DUF1501 family)